MALAAKHNDVWREVLLHGLLTLLMGLGLALPVLHIFGLMGSAWLCAGVLVLMSALLSMGDTGRMGQIGVSVMLVFGAGVWVFSGGLQQALSVFYALRLHLSGVTSALPLYAGETAVLIALLMSFAAYVFTCRWMGPAAVLPVMVIAAALWMSGSDHRFVLLLPAIAAAATCLGCAMHTERGGRRILPWMALLAVCACMLTPPSGTTVEPLKQAADQVRQTIYDYFYFNQSRNVFSLASEGYYPQGSGQLGGPAEPSNHAVLLAETDRRVYLRGVVKDTYTGRTWLDTIGSKRYLWVSPNRRGERTNVFDADLPPQQLLSDSIMPTQRVTVTMLADGASTLFVPQRIRTLNVGGDMVPYFNDASEVFITRDLAEGDTYTVYAPLMLAGDVGLDTIVEACGQTANQQAYQRMQSAYTKLPNHLQSQVYALAQTAAGAAQTPYQQALNVQNYLRSHFRYTLQAEHQPSNVDFVANFLLSSKKGYCTHFASAMTVMCRMLGLPARYVEGYLAEPGPEGVAYVTGLEAHAWTEVYFAGFGWLTFDATPPRHDSPNTPPKQPDPPQPSAEPDSSPTPSPAPEEPTPTPEPPQEPETTPDPNPEHTQAPTNAPAQYTPAPTDQPDAPDNDDDQPDLTLLWLALAALLLLLLLALLVWRVLSMRPEALAAKAKGDEARWQVWTQAVHDQLHILRMPRYADESPQAYLCRVADQPDMPDMLALLGEMENYIAYGRYLPRADEVEDTRQIYQAINALMKPAQRLKLMLMRAFTSGKRRVWHRI